ncbi:hypothetical protein VTO73DRAFT_4475 [Trametes versicolor]
MVASSACFGNGCRPCDDLAFGRGGPGSPAQREGLVHAQIGCVTEWMFKASQSSPGRSLLAIRTRTPAAHVDFPLLKRYRVKVRYPGDTTGGIPEFVVMNEQFMYFHAFSSKFSVLAHRSAKVPTLGPH